jgi:hypothetical protein
MIPITFSNVYLVFSGQLWFILQFIFSNCTHQNRKLIVYYFPGYTYCRVVDLNIKIHFILFYVLNVYSTSILKKYRLYLNRFRGKPASTKLRSKTLQILHKARINIHQMIQENLQSLTETLSIRSP